MMTVNCILTYHEHLNEDKPLLIFIQLPFLHEARFIWLEKIREKEEIWRKARENQEKSEKIRKVVSFFKFAFSKFWNLELV